MKKWKYTGRGKTGGTTLKLSGGIVLFARYDYLSATPKAGDRAGFTVSVNGKRVEESRDYACEFESLDAAMRFGMVRTRSSLNEALRDLNELIESGKEIISEQGWLSSTDEVTG